MSNISDIQISSIMEEFIKEINKKHEELIKNILHKLLNREAVLEDFKQVKIFSENNDLNKRYLTYKDFKLGFFITKIDYEKCQTVCEFFPFETKDFLESATNEDGTKVTF